MTLQLDSKVWGPWYWGFLHTATMTYPVHPNAVTKKKYYDFINSIPLFIPVGSMSGEFSRLLENYPVSPYLDSREALVRWMHFIHNKMNERLEKPKLTLEEFLTKYYDFYKPTIVKQDHWKQIKEKGVYVFVLSLLIFMIVYFYPK
jgi:FAD-linked sulfhydryl oxidase